MKNLKKILQYEANNNTPDIYSKIMADAERDNLFNSNIQQEPVKKKENNYSLWAFVKSYKKTISAIGAFALILLIAISVILPKINKPIVDNGYKSVELSVNDFYGIGAVSTIKLFNNSDSGIQLQSNDTDNSIQTYKNRAKSFNKYFSALDCFLNNESFSSTVLNNTDLEYSEYQYKLQISTIDILNNKSDFVLYYNEKLSRSFDLGTESNYILDGVMVYDGTEYKLLGERGVDSDSNETEKELKIRAFLDAESGSYVEMEQEISTEKGEREIEYVYRVFSQNELVEETAIEFEDETKNGSSNTEFSIYFRKGNEVGFCKTHHNKNSNEINLEFDFNGEKGDFIVTVDNDLNGVKRYNYKLPNNEKFEIYN